ncbi:hypothetical protein F5B17DRAFT_454210 [Nemania serpens]|nr:hypothetical protein F5B17DRAFT_454210 [Nemania serpens]
MVGDRHSPGVPRRHECVFAHELGLFCVSGNPRVFIFIDSRRLKSTHKTEGNSWTLQRMLFVYALTWDHDPFDQGREIMDHSRRPPVLRRSGFPSWSWTGWKRRPNLWRAAEDPAEVIRIPGLKIRAIETASGEVIRWSDATSYFAARQDEPMFLIGEANVVPRIKFLSDSTWEKLHDEDKASRSMAGYLADRGLVC